MGMSPPLITTKRFEWAFFMPYTVSVGTCDPPNFVFTPIRSRSVLCTVGLDPVFYHEALVLPLPFFVGHCGHQRSSCDGDISFQNTRGWIFRLSGAVNVFLSCSVECLLEIGQHPEEAEENEQSAYRQIFRLRAVHLMAFFILVYVGYVPPPEVHQLELNVVQELKLQLAAGSSRTSFKSGVVVHPPVIFPRVSLEV